MADMTSHEVEEKEEEGGGRGRRRRSRGLKLQGHVLAIGTSLLICNSNQRALAVALNPHF